MNHRFELLKIHGLGQVLGESRRQSVLTAIDADQTINTSPDPDRFDIARNPTRHLAFGSGIHMCAGMSLARLEGRIAVERFLKRFPDYRLDGAPTRSRRARFRGFTALPVRLS